jgi:hypothetical protein
MRVQVEVVRAEAVEKWNGKIHMYRPVNMYICPFDPLSDWISVDERERLIVTLLTIARALLALSGKSTQSPPNLLLRESTML